MARFTRENGYQLHAGQRVIVREIGGRFALLRGEIISFESPQVARVLLDGVLQIIPIHVSKLTA